MHKKADRVQDPIILRCAFRLTDFPQLDILLFMQIYTSLQIKTHEKL